MEGEDFEQDLLPVSIAMNYKWLEGTSRPLSLLLYEKGPTSPYPEGR